MKPISPAQSEVLKALANGARLVAVYSWPQTLYRVYFRDTNREALREAAEIAERKAEGQRQRAGEFQLSSKWQQRYTEYAMVAEVVAEAIRSRAQAPAPGDPADRTDEE